jgi:hypothetical protein
MGVYGSDGWSMINITTVNPSYVSPWVSGGASYTWSASTTDLRALQSVAASEITTANRVAATQYTYTNMSFNLPVTDGTHHKLSAYFVDWDNTNRNETVQIVDATTDKVLDTRVVSNFHNGIWYSWTISGDVNLVITDNTTLTTNNAVISGVFFDPIVEGTSPTISLTAPIYGGGYSTPSYLFSSVGIVTQFSANSPVGIASATISIDSNPPVASGTSVTVSAGSHTFNVVATDNWGGVSNIPGTFTVIQPPPPPTPPTPPPPPHQICTTCPTL